MRFRIHSLVITITVMLGFLSCSQEVEHTAAAIHDRDSVSMMVSYGVNTLVSDSGVIKYKIVTERWDVNTVKHPTRWTFEKGIFMEQFDEKFHVEAYVQADTAWYYDQLKLWELRGRVRIRNVNGLVFTSEELYWDGMKHELYSNKFSRVVTPERTLQGTYFRSDERMTRYTVSNSKGSFVKDSMDDNSTAPATSAPSSTTPDTAKVEPLRPAATKRAATKNTSVTHQMQR
ncbi:MAG: LPS export ABC transporter periplasmic protein LptC [Prevotella sp.]|nr:LPS export ABC transporter periplasmic protein LptC [Prevotella sp.]